MPYTVLAKNAMLDALRALITHVGAFQAGADIAVTGTAADDTFTSNGHGLANGDLIAFKVLNGGDARLGPNKPLFVIGSTANTFQLAERPGGPAYNFAANVTAGSSINKYTELNGGAPAYARKAIAYNAAVEGAADDSTNGAVLDVPAGAKVNAIGQFSAVVAGTLHVFNVVGEEAFGAQGTYTVTDADLDLLAA